MAINVVALFSLPLECVADKTIEGRSAPARGRKEGRRLKLLLVDFSLGDMLGPRHLSTGLFDLILCLFFLWTK